MNPTTEQLEVTTETTRAILRLLGDRNVSIEVGISAMMYAVCMVAVTENINKRALLDAMTKSIEMMYMGQGTTPEMMQ